ncbi:HEAT repeat-containing protein 1-like [Palaemon carinicauda]|uniref:HEAT repeat-containing protein 1-like n=1 Tax=Palaemon carinicauda TaxID=392227 RepID=UPI0035B5F077
MRQEEEFSGWFASRGSLRTPPPPSVALPPDFMEPVTPVAQLQAPRLVAEDSEDSDSSFSSSSTSDVISSSSSSSLEDSSGREMRKKRKKAKRKKSSSNSGPSRKKAKVTRKKNKKMKCSRKKRAKVMTQKFFASIEKENCQAALWSHLIGCVVESEDAVVASRLRSGLRKTSLDAQSIVKEIENLNLATKVTSMRNAQAKRIKQKKTQKEYSIELQNWKKLGLMLETIGVMSSLGRPWLLTNVLCQCLQQTLTLDSVITESVQQQILSALLHLLQKSKEELGRETSKNVKLNVELIVQCIRSSVSPDTHRRAMLILSLVADIFPDVVLHNMMSIFTFMGTSLLRRDDSYSFQVIHQTIKNIVPVLIKCESGSEELLFKLANVCQVFFDAFPDLPEHRRLPLFIQLANTIEVKNNLWILLALMADSHVMKGIVSEASDNTEEARRSVPHIIEFALTLCSEFSVLDQVNACYKLMEYVSRLPEDIESLLQKKKMGKGKKHIDIISWEAHSTKQYINFKYTSTALLSLLLSSEKFVGKVMEGTEGMEEELRDTYQLLLEKTMSYLRTVNESCERNKDKPSSKVWLSLQRKIVDVLDGIISVLPPNMLLQVIDGLLKSPIALVRCRATELLCSKLQPSSTFFSKEDLLDLLPFVDGLRKVATDTQEPIENRQVAIYALQLLIKHLTPHVKIGAITPVMSAAVQLVCCESTPMKVVTQALLVIAEAVGTLKAHAVSHLGCLMPVITRLLVKSDTDSDHLALAAATATHKIIENMAQFLSPHLETLICSVCHLCASKDEAFAQESRLGLRLASMRNSLPQRIEPRLILPKFAAAYKTLSDEDIPALQPLMIMVETLITKAESKVVVAQKPAFVDLFTLALDLRTLKGDHESIVAVEAVVCSALAKLLLRLNEYDNIAVFANLQSWASDVMDIKPSRLITFYRFTGHLAETLKVLFIKAKLADNMFSQAASVLERNNSVDSMNSIFGVGDEAAQKTAVLVKYVLDTLKMIFLHDSVKFTNQERFQIMLHPLINQLENTKIGKELYKDMITYHFIPCVLQFTNAVGDDSLWKELNRAILLKLRNDDEPIVILAALETFEALIDAYGEDYLQPLLADIMPYITEVFETVDPEIEAATKEVYTKMEAILGDSFRSYLDR